MNLPRWHLPRPPGAPPVPRNLQVALDLAQGLREFCGVREGPQKTGRTFDHQTVPYSEFETIWSADLLGIAVQFREVSYPPVRITTADQDFGIISQEPRYALIGADWRAEFALIVDYSGHNGRMRYVGRLCGVLNPYIWGWTVENDDRMRHDLAMLEFMREKWQMPK